MVINSEQFFDSIAVTDGALSKRNYQKLEDGSLLVWARVARTGELDYGSYKQRVSPDVLFNEDSLGSLVAVPVTLEHPPTFISSTQDRQKYSVGVTLQEIEKEISDSANSPSFLTVATLIWDSTAIELIESKAITQVSAGYEAVKEPVTDSLFEQKSRKYNHIALTRSGRAGESVSVQMRDSSNVIGTAVALHCQYKDSLIKAGISPDYNWDSLTLKRTIVGVLSGKDSSHLNESQCDAILTYVPSLGAPNAAVPVVVSDSNDPIKGAEKRYIERVANAYKQTKV